MNLKTLTALRASIKHWEENFAAETPEYASTRGEDCALCRMFFDQGPETPECAGCPVSEKTGRTVCYGSPYHCAASNLKHWGSFPSNENREQWRKAARDEVRFLRSLLPKTKRP